MTIHGRLLAATADPKTQFFRFCAVGAINTVVDFGIYAALTRSFPFWGEHFLAASVVSFCIGVLSSYLLNTFWTFGARTVALRQGAKFFIVAVTGLGWNAAVLALLTALGMYDLLAKAFATAAVLAWNFTWQKRWTFR